MTFFAVAVYHPKRESNVGSLLRSAHAFGAALVLTVGRRYREQSSDTSHATSAIPLVHCRDIDDLVDHLPRGAPLVGIEISPDANCLEQFAHPERATYLLGAEDHGLPPDVIARCHRVIKIDTAFSLNVAVAGSIVMWHRTIQMKAIRPGPNGQVRRLPLDPIGETSRVISAPSTTLVT